MTASPAIAVVEGAGTGQEAPRRALMHLPKLDGLRAFAILAVFLYHANWLQCGWAGVQAFFVLSGFLITRILLQSKERMMANPGVMLRGGGARDYFTTFYWRRMLRIFPLYYAFIGGLVVIFLCTGHPAQLKADFWWLVTYTTNIERIFPGYQSVGTHSHLWSLAVEEQFYFIWPAVIWLASRGTLRRIVAGLILAGPVLRLVAGWLAFRLWHDPLQPGEVVYNLLTSHLDAFASGAAVAMGFELFVRRSMVKLPGFAVVAFVAGGWMLLVHLRPMGVAGFNSLGYPHNMPWNFQYVWGYSVLNLGFALLIAILIRPRGCFGSKVFQFMEWPVMTYLGRISYGLYIFHNPVQVFVARLWHLKDYAPFPVSALAVAMVGTVGVAALSYHFMESWFLKLKDRQPSFAGISGIDLSVKDAASG